MSAVLALCWVITLLASIVAGLFLVFALAKSGGAPQEAAGAAVAVGIVVVPYVFTRAIEGLRAAHRDNEPG